MKVKVCGITSVRDAALGAEAGADALGFIFAPGSRRQVSPQLAREAGLAIGPAVARVGVFMGQMLDEVLHTAEAARVTAVQLHGPFPALYVRQITRYYPVLRVLRPADLAPGAGVWEDLPGVTPMLDAPQPGSGQPLDWVALQASFPAGAWLAGGLGPENVARAIGLLRPAGVDAVSRLESRPGVKDAEAVQAFVRAARQAEAASYPQ